MKKDWAAAHPDKQFMAELFRHIIRVFKKSNKKLKKLAFKGLYDAKRAIQKLMKDNNSLVILLYCLRNNRNYNTIINLIFCSQSKIW